jgi:hypothetical protein
MKARSHASERRVPDVEVLVSVQNGNDRWSNWQLIVGGFRALAKADGKAKLVECELIRAAQRTRAWEPAGCVSLLALLERERGLAPKEARELIRVAGELARDDTGSRRR